MTEYFGTSRDWLREQGFDVGDRGRLSSAMQRAINESGLEFIAPEKQKVNSVDWHTNPYEEQLPVRQSKTLYGFSREGSKIAFTMCFDCKQHMTYCNCKDGILAPSSIVSSKYSVSKT